MDEAVTAARLSWECNYTLIDGRWSLKQLHGLHQLVLNNRDELAKHSAKGSSAQSSETDIACLVGEISQQIEAASQPATSGTTVQFPLLGELEVSSRAAGVCVIAFGQDNPLRWILSPLAASIAAGNVTILAARAPQDSPLVSLLSRELPKYLDRDGVFLVPSFEPAQLIGKTVDRVAVFDESVEPYHDILSSSKGTFIDTSDTASNFAIISEGTKSWAQITRELRNASHRLVMRPDRLHVVFVREEDMGTLQSLLATIAKPTDNALFDGLLRDGGGDIEFESALHTAKKESRLLLVPVKSVDRAFDALISLSGPIAQLALLGPDAHQYENFARRWVPADLVAVDFVYTMASITRALSRRNIFSKSVYRADRNGSKSLPGDIQRIRETYDGLIPPLKPEPRGERIGFFTQAEYLFKGVGLTLGLVVTAGAYFGLQRLRS